MAEGPGLGGGYAQGRFNPNNGPVNMNQPNNNSGPFGTGMGVPRGPMMGRSFDEGGPNFGPGKMNRPDGDHKAPQGPATQPAKPQLIRPSQPKVEQRPDNGPRSDVKNSINDRPTSAASNTDQAVESADRF